MARARSEQDADRRYRLQVRLIDLAGSTASLLIPWGSLVAIAYLISSAIHGLAGKQTLADIGLRLLADVRVTEWVAYILTGGSIAYGLRERKLRRDTIERLSERTQKLEQQLDPNRSSSRLTPRGTTRPEDRT